MKKIVEQLKTFLLALLITGILVFLFGCTSVPTVPTEVKVPTPVACITPGSIPDEPALASLKDGPETSDGTLMLHLAQDLAALKMYSDKLRVITESCSKLN